MSTQNGGTSWAQFCLALWRFHQLSVVSHSGDLTHTQLDDIYIYTYYIYIYTYYIYIYIWNVVVFCFGILFISICFSIVPSVPSYLGWSKHRLPTSFPFTRPFQVRPFWRPPTCVNCNGSVRRNGRGCTKFFWTVNCRVFRRRRFQGLRLGMGQWGKSNR